MTNDVLRITEIFYSLQGESSSVGYPTAFIRLTGCPLRCQYCDSAYAFTGGRKFTISDILEQVAAFKPQYITVTGGEPLAQPGCLNLLSQLVHAGYCVSIETSGAMPIDDIDPAVRIVLDIKTPDSTEVTRNRWQNIPLLKPTDEIKFVICSREDYEWSKACIVEHALAAKAQLLFSPSHEQLAPHLLADWIIADNLPVRFQLQIHKYLWGDVPGK